MLNKPMRFPAENWWGTSDTHFNHGRDFVYSPRGFSNQEAHDETIIQRWNAVTDENSTIVHCGDFALFDPTGSVTENILNRLNGHIYYVNGNHPSGVKQLYKQALINRGLPLDIESYPITYKNITFVGNMFTFLVGHQMIVATHYPMATWEDSHKGSYNICGHEHYGFPDSRNEFRGAKRLDVGIDNTGYLWSFEELKRIMDTKSVTSVGHHG